ncbi:hypothetical protein BB934_36235 (plasmid) [Microvirga ossetica]|uniref:Cation/H+ exchanger domain-containing protein n=1 Tax=Microvirga ossetica TaxID=1882682 RepID=A0A1B2EUP8_9HYPH|nr:hypothetical protein [Microvirga ossetica]ANY83696.1 hypothetical protein BB934_36235 [Microvirga ossetica]
MRHSRAGSSGTVGQTDRPAEVPGRTEDENGKDERMTNLPGHGMTPSEIAPLLLFASAAFGWVNHRVIKLPHTIGMLIMSLLASFAVLGADAAFPALGIEDTASAAFRNVDFADTRL